MAEDNFLANLIYIPETVFKDGLILLQYLSASLNPDTTENLSTRAIPYASMIIMGGDSSSAHPVS